MRAILVLAVLGLVFWFGHFMGRRSVVSRRTSRESTLLAVCVGDQAHMERLIALEQRRAPGATREEAIQLAIEWSQRDNK